MKTQNSPKTWLSKAAKISIQHATTNIYIQQTSINTTKGGIIEVK
jgi:hypothetical protein